jgi:hypothetical protein
LYSELLERRQARQSPTLGFSLLDELANLPVLDNREPDDILGYDENRPAMSIVADTSAFMSILQKERDAGLYRQTLLDADKVLISTATVVELHIVVTAKLGAEGILRFSSLLAQSLFEIVPVDHYAANG